jgi:hypothetical protein
LKKDPVEMVEIVAIVAIVVSAVSAVSVVTAAIVVVTVAACVVDGFVAFAQIRWSLITKTFRSSSIICPSVARLFRDESPEPAQSISVL